MNAEQNLRLLQEIDANRLFILTAYRQNPQLLEHAEPRVRQWFDAPAWAPLPADGTAECCGRGTGA